MKYVFDLDGTVFSIKPFLLELNKLTNKKLKIRDNVQYDLYKTYQLDSSNPKTKDEFNAILLRAFRIQKPNLALLKAMQVWKNDGIEFYYVTARDEIAREATLYNMRRWEIPLLDEEHLIMGQKHKANALIKLNGIRYFDDSPFVMQELNASPKVRDRYELTIIDAPYNKEINLNSRFKFTTHKDEAYKTDFQNVLNKAKNFNGTDPNAVEELFQDYNAQK